MTIDVRLGHGFDVHQFCDGDCVTLCGVKIPYSKSLLGHSDADVGLHALTDALYGALGAGDIGQHFPPSEAQWKDRDSTFFLKAASDLVAKRLGTIMNVDVTLICEQPKIGPHAQAMVKQIASTLSLSPSRVNVKATTTETLGFTGREEGIAAMATAAISMATDSR